MDNQHCVSSLEAEQKKHANIPFMSWQNGWWATSIRHHLGFMEPTARHLASFKMKWSAHAHLLDQIAQQRRVKSSWGSLEQTSSKKNAPLLSWRTSAAVALFHGSHQGSNIFDRASDITSFAFPGAQKQAAADQFKIFCDGNATTKVGGVTACSSQVNCFCSNMAIHIAIGLPSGRFEGLHSSSVCGPVPFLFIWICTAGRGAVITASACLRIKGRPFFKTINLRWTQTASLLLSGVCTFRFLQVPRASCIRHESTHSNLS